MVRTATPLDALYDDCKQRLHHTITTRDLHLYISECENQSLCIVTGVGLSYGENGYPIGHAFHRLAVHSHDGLPWA